MKNNINTVASMENLKRNQLAELIIEDGQPARAIINYLQEVLNLLKGFDCITDYYTPKEGHPLHLFTPKLKMTKEFFIDAVSISYSQLKKINNKPLELEDLYLNFNYEFNSTDIDFNEEIDEPTVSYYLSTDDKDSCNMFLIVFNNNEDPILCTIDVQYSFGEFYTEECDVHYNPIKFKRINKNNETILLTINGTCGDEIIEYKEDDVSCIVPLDEIAI